MVTDIDDVESNNSAQLTVTAQINSSSSEASEPAGNGEPAASGHSNAAFVPDDQATTSF